ncbi:MAG TPA: enoyl-CoA hydratase-related protein [Chitinophagaceae bacterium]|nr:enoyl-CoA hydratase-related protein [Chitinophagaceae bacterium]
MYDTLLVETVDHCCVVTINRPEKLNALNREVFQDLNRVLDLVEKDASIRSVLITGAGSKAFVAGADISEFSGLDREQAMALARRGQDTFFRIENSPKPIVAAVNGFALGGGCELAMACHFRIASEHARFGQPEVNLGLVPGYGGTQRLPQLIGKGRALELLLTAGMIDAQEAFRCGLVNHVVPAQELIEKTLSILRQIQGKAPVAVAECIRCANLSASGQSGGYAQEVESFGTCFTTKDREEGVAAFLEKRQAVFTGK